VFRQYKIFRNVTSWSEGSYSLVPIRDIDKFDIMKWRNDQVSILRQNEILTEEKQSIYFRDVVNELFEEEQPKQILFSFLYNKKLIGYGGLVHIDWSNKSAEISFLTETNRSLKEDIFISDWSIYLKILKKIVNNFLNIERIFTYSYDLRPKLYVALLRNDFFEEKRIKNGMIINKKNIDILIHSYNFINIYFKLAEPKHVDLYFEWANDEVVRDFSYQKQEILRENHISWFNQKIRDCKTQMLIFYDKMEVAIGQVRIENTNDEIVIGISIDKNHRGKSLGSKMIFMACCNWRLNHPSGIINAYVKARNIYSKKIFENVGFSILEELDIEGEKSFRLIYT